MNRLLIYGLLAIIGLTNGGQLMGKMKLKKSIRQYKDTVEVLRQDSAKIAIKYKEAISSDSLHKALLGQTQATMQGMNKEMVYLRKWKLQAEANGVVTDTLKVRKKLFGGYKVVK